MLAGEQQRRRRGRRFCCNQQHAHCYCPLLLWWLVLLVVVSAQLYVSELLIAVKSNSWVTAAVVTFSLITSLGMAAPAVPAVQGFGRTGGTFHLM